MKKTKVLLTLVCAVLLVAASVMGTLAFLTDNDTVTNTFTVGKVDLGEDGKAGLDEAKVNTDGTYVTDVNNRVQENTYKLMPGHSYIKDPTIHVAKGSEDCFLFVTVKNDISGIESTASTYSNIEAQMAAKGWKKLTGATAGTDEVVWFYADSTASVDTLKTVKQDNSKTTDVPVFDKFEIKGDIDNNALASYAGKTIVVKAYAIQADGFTATDVNSVWTALYGQVNSTKA